MKRIQTDFNYSFKVKHVMLLTFLFLGLFNTFGQVTIKGTVSDTTSAPLPGVAIIIKGNETKGTQTDFDGKFEYSDLVSVNVLRELHFTVNPNPACDKLEMTFAEMIRECVNRNLELLYLTSKSINKPLHLFSFYGQGGQGGQIIWCI